MSTDQMWTGEHYLPSTRIIAEAREAIVLRRPLLILGDVQGPWALACFISWRLGLGPVLQWSVSKSSTIMDGLYYYDRDAMERERSVAYQRGEIVPPISIARYIRLGPLGTALLPTPRPRVLVINDIDQATEEFSSNLAVLVSSGEFQIPQLFAESRNGNGSHEIYVFDGPGIVEIRNGMIACKEPPIVVMSATSSSSVRKSIFNISITTQEELTHKMAEDIVRVSFPDDWNLTTFQHLAKEAIERFLLSRQFGYEMSLQSFLDELYVDHAEGRLRKFVPRAFYNAPSAFLSYRRSDSLAKAVILRIRELCLNAGFKFVFVDVQRDSTPLGVSYDDVLKEAIMAADVFFVVMGDQWTSILQERSQDVRDSVVWEIQQAFNKSSDFEKRIIPLLLQSSMPLESQLPEAIRRLHYRNGIHVDDIMTFEEELLPSLRALLIQVEKDRDSGLSRYVGLDVVDASCQPKHEAPLADRPILNQVTPVQYSTEPAMSALTDELTKLGSLKTQGLLSEEEFAAAKKKLLEL
jgi:hypothetical protein